MTRNTPPLAYSAAVLLLLLQAVLVAAPTRFEPGKAAMHFPQDASRIEQATAPQRLSYADVLKRITPAVVSVFPARLAKPGEVPEDEVLKRFFGEKKKEEQGDERFRSMGSGVVISSDGYLFTNSHVVHLPNGKLADEIVVEFSNRRRMPATIIGADKKADIAVLKVDATDLPVLPMSDSSNIAVGDLVFAVGNPFKVGMTATMGMVSATNRSGVGIMGPDGLESFIQTDAAINPGNSGGALCDASGRLVGINTAIYGPGGNIGIGFAVPVNIARRVLFNLLENGRLVRGFLGARVKSVDDTIARQNNLSEIAGAYIEEVLESGPAAKAGLKKGDIVLRLGSEAIPDASAFRVAAAFAAPGTRIPLTGMRDGQLLDLAITVESQEETSTAGSAMEIEALPGVRLREVSGGEPTLHVDEVASDSPFAKKLEAGMTLVEINDTKINTRADASGAFRRGRNKVRIARDGGESETLLLNIK